MATKRALTEFGNQLEKLLTYFSIEFDMTVAEILGVMDIAKFNLLNQVSRDMDEDFEEDEEEDLDG